MNDDPVDAPANGFTAEYIAHEEFRTGLPMGRFRVIVDPVKAGPFVAQRVNVPALSLALLGPGVVLALTGHALLGGLLVVSGILLKRLVRLQAPKILLHLAVRQRATYQNATEGAVMEVRRVERSDAAR